MEIAPSGNAYLKVTFTPKDTSRQNGYIILTSNASGSPDSLAVNGKGETLTNINNNPSTPLSFSLSQNYPNPFNPSTKIKYELPVASKVTIKIYDILGREVTTLVNKSQNAGRYEIEFNANNLPSGVYIYQIRANEFISARKLMLIK